MSFHFTSLALLKHESKAQKRSCGILHFISARQIEKALTMRFHGNFIICRYLSRLRNQFNSNFEFPLPNFRHRAPFFLRSYSAGNSSFNLFVYSYFIIHLIILISTLYSLINMDCSAQTLLLV